jgi:integrase
VVEFAADGTRSSHRFDSEKAAKGYIAMATADIKTAAGHTTSSVLDLYEAHYKSKGNRSGFKRTRYAIEMFFHEEVAIALLSEKKCKALYERLRTTPLTRTKKPPSVDTHRNILAEVKTFLRWCVDQGWLRSNPAERLQGIGRRRPRGKSLRPDGEQMKIREARAWYVAALDLAKLGDEGATAALVACLLGLRASEIVSRRVRHLDEDQQAGDLLWIPCSKTESGKRQLEVPEELRLLLNVLAEGKGQDRFLFEASKPSVGSPDGQPHWRDWPRHQVHRICDLVKVPRVTAHAMRGVLATVSYERGVAGHLIAATLGHSDERVSQNAYAAPGSAASGARKEGLKILQGGRK